MTKLSIALPALLAGCLVTHVEGDPGPRPSGAGTVHRCRIEIRCGPETHGVLEETHCAADTGELADEVANQCWEDHAMACGGFCTSSCDDYGVPCVL